MKTLSDLKRALTVGTKITLVEAPDMPSHKYLNVPRYVIKTQTNGVTLALEPTAAKGSFMDLPRASLVEFDGDTIKIFNVGSRELTKDEEVVICTLPSRQPENAKQCEIDAMSDGSNMYYKDMAHYKHWNMEHLAGNGTVRGLRLDHNTNKVYDETIKGTLQLAYKLA